MVLLALVLSVPALAATFPGPTACALLELAPVDGDDVLFERTLSRDQRRAAESMLGEARARVRARLGLTSARARVLFLDDGRTLWPFSFNDFGSTHFLGTRACVVIGREGRNVDVVAHELTHAALFERLGAWNRAWLATWFDEGVAMQVDDRAPYQGAPEDVAVRHPTRPGQFFTEPLTAHYAGARALVAAWRERLSEEGWDEALTQLSEGAALEDVWPERRLAGSHRAPREAEVAARRVVSAVRAAA